MTHVQTAQIQSQWAANNIRIDPAIIQQSMPAITVAVRFSGTALEINDQDSLIMDIQRAVDQYNVPMEIVTPDEAPNSEYSIMITFRTNQRTNMIGADLTLALRRGSRNLKTSDRHTFNEMTMEYLIRKAGDVIMNDRAFFESLPGIIAQQ